MMVCKYLNAVFVGKLHQGIVGFSKGSLFLSMLLHFD